MYKTEVNASVFLCKKARTLLPALPITQTAMKLLKVQIYKTGNSTYNSFTLFV